MACRKIARKKNWKGSVYVCSRREKVNLKSPGRDGWFFENNLKKVGGSGWGKNG